MSWSKSASGTKNVVQQRVKEWAKEQRETDVHMSKEASDGHAAQVEAAAASVHHLVEGLPDHVNFSVSAWGHHNGEPLSSQGGLSISYTVPPDAQV